MTEQTELKPCPFCGGDGELRDLRIQFAVRCNNCGHQAFSASYAYIDSAGDFAETDEEADALCEAASDSINWDEVANSAIAAWNRRA